jgi:hypothetical protein
MEETNRENMATLLENQAAQLLRESSTMGGGDVGGFTNIAFPIVRRVFGGLVANELVSIQPMSLPSGLLFYLDYTYGDAGTDGADGRVYKEGDSIYGSPNGRSIQDGASAVGGQYDLAGSGYSRVRAQSVETKLGASRAAAAARFFAFSSAGELSTGEDNSAVPVIEHTHFKNLKLLSFDEDVVAKVRDEDLKLSALAIPLTTTNFPGIDVTALKEVAVFGDDLTGLGNTDSLGLQGGKGLSNIRRLNRIVTWDGAGEPKDAPNPSLGDADTYLLAIVVSDEVALLADDGEEFGTDGADDVGVAAKIELDFVKADSVSVDSNSTGEIDGAPAFEYLQGADDPAAIPEIDIKIESIPVTAQTRKLRARWSPELAQDLNAYHSMDAEVELTQILSEQIALEIDREILGDILSGAQGANFFWSRSPGKFVNKRTGAEVARASTLNPGPAFTGTVREWYETLTETVIDVANEIHRKTLRGSANFIVVSPDVATILEASVLYRPSYSLDGDGQVGTPFTMGAEKIGTLSNRFTVYKDPYFPRNKILVGYKGGSYLETGFVYAPYVPLIVTPTIFQPEDFTPRKGVMTRYGKKMVRADFYGTVTCLDMNVI